MSVHITLLDDNSDDIGTAVVTNGPAGIVEVQLHLNGTGWVITQMESYEEDLTGADVPQPAYTIVTLSR